MHIRIPDFYCTVYTEYFLEGIVPFHFSQVSISAEYSTSRLKPEVGSIFGGKCHSAIHISRCIGNGKWRKMGRCNAAFAVLLCTPSALCIDVHCRL